MLINYFKNLLVSVSLINTNNSFFNISSVGHVRHSLLNFKIVTRQSSFTFACQLRNNFKKLLVSVDRPMLFGVNVEAMANLTE